MPDDEAPSDAVLVTPGMLSQALRDTNMSFTDEDAAARADTLFTSLLAQPTLEEVSGEFPAQATTALPEKGKPIAGGPRSEDEIAAPLPTAKVMTADRDYDPAPVIDSERAADDLADDQDIERIPVADSAPTPPEATRERPAPPPSPTPGGDTVQCATRGFLLVRACKLAVESWERNDGVGYLPFVLEWRDYRVRLRTSARPVLVLQMRSTRYPDTERAYYRDLPREDVERYAKMTPAQLESFASNTMPAEYMQLFPITDPNDPRALEMQNRHDELVDLGGGKQAKLRDEPEFADVDQLEIGRGAID